MDPLETLSYKWYRYNDDLGEFTSEILIEDVDASDLGLYRLVVSNGYGTTIVTVPIQEGGTPATWNGTDWIYPRGFVSPTAPNPGGLDTVVSDADRRLVIAEDWDRNIDLEGCNCLIPAGNEVTIRSGKHLKLYSELIVRANDTIPGVDINGNPTETIILGGILNIEDDASLIQLKDVLINENTGAINKERIAETVNS